MGRFLSPVFTVSLEMLLILHYLMKHHSVGLRVVIVFDKNNFSADFFWKAEISEFFRNRFDISHCPLSFLILTIVFYRRTCRIHLLTAKLHWRRRSWPVAENFPPVSFWRKQLKTQIFSDGKCYFGALPWINIQTMASHCSLGDRIWSVRSI